MSGTVKGDMYALGGTVTTNGTVENDLTVVGGSVQVIAPVNDDVRVLGGEVTIGSYIKGDVFVIGGVLHVLSTATIDGDIIFFGGEADINGTVGGSVLGTSKQLRIDGEVKGDVDVTTASTLTLGDKANIAGFVNYASVSPIVRAQNAVVAKEVTQRASVTATESEENKTRAALVPIFITLFATLSLFLLFKKELQNLVVHTQRKAGKSFLLGLSVLVLGPIVALILAVTVLGVLLGVISFALVLLAYALGYVLTGVVFGAYLAQWFTKSATVSLPWILVGSLSLQILLMVPVVGVLTVFTLFAITVGGLVVGTYSLLS
jgi:cytoskeletal protein CcmA (bactofilin family)